VTPTRSPSRAAVQLATQGSKRVHKVALLGAIPPFLLKTADNPEGVDGQIFEGIKAAIVEDRYAYFEDFLRTRRVRRGCTAGRPT
jgi:hypothetical protein